ncbi:hypothetical protein ACTFIR_009448 [Dictyostelium discoideum]
MALEVLCKVPNRKIPKGVTWFASSFIEHVFLLQLKRSINSCCGAHSLHADRYVSHNPLVPNPTHPYFHPTSDVNASPFGTHEGIYVSSTVKNNDTDLLIVEKRIKDSLKLLLLMSSMLSSDSSNIDVELISYLAQSAIVLAVDGRASLIRVRHNNIAKEIYAPRIFTIVLRLVLRMLRDINVSVIAYLDDLLIVVSTKEICLYYLKKTLDLLIKLGFKLNLEKSVLELTQSNTLAEQTSFNLSTLGISFSPIGLNTIIRFSRTI